MASLIFFLITRAESCHFDWQCRRSINHSRINVNEQKLKKLHFLPTPLLFHVLSVQLPAYFCEHKNSLELASS